MRPESNFGWSHDWEPLNSAIFFEVVICDLALGVEGPGAGVRMIALVMDTLVPIVKRSSTILLFDLFDPWIFARRLIKMPVETDANFFGHNQQTLSSFAQKGYSPEKNYNTVRKQTY